MSVLENFIFHNPTKIMFGKGSLTGLASEIKALNVKKVLICYGSSRIKNSGLFDDVTSRIEEAGAGCFELGGIEPNPDIFHVRKGAEICRRENIDFILPVGGGSVVDCAKGVAFAALCQGDPWDHYMQKEQVSSALPLGVVLTLAATGSEMNGNSVVSSREHQLKMPVKSPLLYPKFSILDPELTFSVPPYQTAAGTVDIMSHVFEFYFSVPRGEGIADYLSEAVLKTCVEYGPRALENPEDYPARANLLWAGTLALNGLLATGRGMDLAAHRMEHEASALYPEITHGAGLAVIHPAWMDYVLDDENRRRFEHMGSRVFGVSGAEEGIAALKKFILSLGMPSTLGELGIRESDIPLMAQGATRFGPTGQLKKLDTAQVEKLLRGALQPYETA